MSSPKANRIRLKVPHTNFLTGQFNAHDKDCETGWNPKAQKPQIEMYYRTLMEDDTNTPFHKNLIPLEKFVKHFQGKAKDHELNRLKDQPKHWRVSQEGKGRNVSLKQIITSSFAAHASDTYLYIFNCSKDSVASNTGGGHSEKPPEREESKRNITLPSLAVSYHHHQKRSQSSTRNYVEALTISGWNVSCEKTGNLSLWRWQDIGPFHDNTDSTKRGQTIWCAFNSKGNIWGPQKWVRTQSENCY